ncbi:hypothetical protein GW17_00029428 [Ensete ventricosum]|nr:hypothetical protein GW17_00029428 [Ensete ventricosum]RZS19136.1 hypothetical protein BHM03_00051488 [Ensete ventricosum]
MAWGTCEGMFLLFFFSVFIFLSKSTTDDRFVARGLPVGDGWYGELVKVCFSSSSSPFSYFSRNRQPTTDFDGTARMYRSTDGPVHTAWYGALPLGKENLAPKNIFA